MTILVLLDSSGLEVVNKEIIRFRLLINKSLSFKLSINTQISFRLEL